MTVNHVMAWLLFSWQLYLLPTSVLAADSALQMGAPTLNSLHFQDPKVDTNRAFQSLRSTPWYDPQTQDFAPPKVVQERDNEIRFKGKMADSKPASRSNWDWGNWFDWLGSLIASFFSWTMLIVIASLLTIAVVALLIFAFRDYLPNRREPARLKKGIDIDLARVEALPFEVRATSLDPLSEAQRLMRAGDYDSAIIYLYGYMLLALDQSRKIHLQKGKTNRMYLRELNRGGNPSLRRIVESTMLAFEQVYFGKHSLTSEHFQAMWGQLDEFHHLVSPQSESELASPVVEVAAT